MIDLKKRMCYYIPIDAFIPDHGWRVSIVIEDEPGHRPTGNWPYTGKPVESMPYFWGSEDYSEAERICKNQNKRMGLSDKDVVEIISSSMSAGQLKSDDDENFWKIGSSIARVVREHEFMGERVFLTEVINGNGSTKISLFYDFDRWSPATLKDWEAAIHRIESMDDY